MSTRRPPTRLDRFRPEGGSVWLFILSLFLSVLYWSYTVSELKSVKDLSVPLQYANLSPNVIVVGEDARRSVTVEFKGSPDLLKRVREEDVDARIDVGKLQPGPQVVELDRENVRLPSSVEFVRTYPKLIHFSLDRRLKDTLPLRPNFTGRTAPGSQVLSWSIEPPTVQVEGPESLVRKLLYLSTQPVPLDGRSTGFEIPVVTGHTDADLAILSPSPATLRVVIGEKRLQRTIAPIAIGVVHGGKHLVTLEVPSLKVMVEGPESLVRNLAPEDFVAEVDVQGLRPSDKPYQIKPSLRLARSDLVGKVMITGWVDRFVGIRVEKGAATPPQPSEPAAPPRRRGGAPVNRQYFGTDGMRGRAGQFPLDPPTVYALGRAAGRILGGKDARALVAADTRESCGWIASHLVAGLRETGVECLYAGVLPTPAVARLCVEERFTFGAMISASHNPYEDNGIKLFSGEGFKLPDDTEHHIETALDGLLPSLPNPVPSSALGPPSADLSGRYLSWLESLWEGPDLSGFKVLLDCANGAAYETAPALFRHLGASVSVFASEPDGRNINAGCGSLHTDVLSQRVRDGGAHFGFAFDGDADRCLAVTSAGRVLDGDVLLYRDAQRRVKRGTLWGRWVVGTVMSNLWLEQALQAERLRFFRAPVGDRYVLQCMLDRGAMLGGEPSGHVLFLDRATTGDGLLTALTYASLARDAGSMDAVAEGITPYPQVLSNIRVHRRLPLQEQPLIQRALDEETSRLGGRGRIVLRYSGTEPLLRLMVEAQTAEDVNGVIDRLGKVLRESLGEA